jgi:hypothetical protein
MLTSQKRRALPIRLLFHFYAHSRMSMPAISVRACVLGVRKSVLRLCVSLGRASYQAYRIPCCAGYWSILCSYCTCGGTRSGEMIGCDDRSCEVEWFQSAPWSVPQISMNDAHAPSQFCDHQCFGCHAPRSAASSAWPCIARPVVSGTAPRAETAATPPRRPRRPDNVSPTAPMRRVSSLRGGFPEGRSVLAALEHTCRRGRVSREFRTRPSHHSLTRSDLFSS